jgi:hypothetical protein
MKELRVTHKAEREIFWLVDEGVEESDNLPDPDVIAHFVADDLGNVRERPVC